MGYADLDSDAFMNLYMQQYEIISQHKGSFLTSDSYDGNEDDLFAGYIQQFDNIDEYFPNTIKEDIVPILP